MGQLTNISSLHLLQNKSANSYWYVDYNLYGGVFVNDFLIFLYLRSQSSLTYSLLKRKHLYEIEIVKICIYRTNKTIILNLELIYLKNKYLKTENLQQFTKRLLRNVKKTFLQKNLSIFYQVGSYNAKFIALRIATLLEKRIKFRSKIIEKFLRKKMLSGIRVTCKGRLNGVDRARKDQISFGSIPLQSLTARIDYGIVIANTKKGLQSVKVWVFKK